jgi:hypothetical protein
MQLRFREVFMKSEIEYTIHSLRFYGEPKLSKPKELRGIKQIGSVDFVLDKCKCQIFALENDIWVKHNDYFSRDYVPLDKESGLPLDYFMMKFKGKVKNKKFVYGDAWGGVVLRNEAWIRIINLAEEIKRQRSIIKLKQEILEQQEKLHEFEKGDLWVGDWERFWENVIKEIKNKM